jgi:hypothetical protein
MAERNDERNALRIAIAREVFLALIGGQLAQTDVLHASPVTIRQMATQSVALADALIDALGEGR